MSESFFHFNQTAYLENFTFDHSLEQFRRQFIDHGVNSESTIREIIQNSLDAKNHDINEPVKIKFSLQKVSKNVLPGINEVFEHIDSLKPGNEYNSETVKHMKGLKNQSQVTVLTAEDSNTKGLSGAEAKDEASTYKIYAYNKGVHATDTNEKIEKTRGGSHGVGKIANNAASDIHLMYFANCDEYGKQHLGGSVQLFDHQIDDKMYRGTGYFATLDESGELKAFQNRGFHPIFKKETRGLKIIIPYLREEMNNEIDIIKSVCNNFFVAILDQQLEVEFHYNDTMIEISHRTLDNIIATYYPSNVSEMKNELLPLYVDTYQNSEPINLEVKLAKKYNTTYHFKLYYSDDNDEIPTGRVAVVRGIGMKIEERKIKGRVRTPFNAVLIGGTEEDQYLKTLENESHTKLSNDLIRNSDEKRKATNFLNTLDRQITAIIDESFSKQAEEQLSIDTSDLIYQLNWEFSKNLKDKKQIVELKKGQQEIIIDNDENKIKEKRDKGSFKGTNQATNKRGPRQPRKTQSGDRNEGIESYVLSNDTVQRVVLDHKEMIHFDLQSENWKKVHLGLKLVNGQGEEIDDAIDLTQIYTKVTETLSGHSNLRIDRTRIYDIPVTNQSIYLEADLAPNYNPSLKFIYKIEVVE